MHSPKKKNKHCNYSALAHSLLEKKKKLITEKKNNNKKRHCSYSAEVDETKAL